MSEYRELTIEIWDVLEANRYDTPAAFSQMESRLASFAAEQRRKALEEAAKICDEQAPVTQDWDGTLETAMAFRCRDAIRRLATEPLKRGESK